MIGDMVRKLDGKSRKLANFADVLRDFLTDLANFSGMFTTPPPLVRPHAALDDSTMSAPPRRAGRGAGARLYAVRRFLYLMPLRDDPYGHTTSEVR